MTPAKVAPAVPSIGSSVNVLGFQLDWMVLALIIVLAALVWALYRAQLSVGNQIDLMDLLSEEGKLSRPACVLMGSFGVTTWMMIQLTLNGKMTDGYFLAYSGAWIAPSVTRMIVNAAAGKPEVKP